MLICMISIWVCWIKGCEVIHFRCVLHLTSFDSISIRFHASQHNHMQQFFFHGWARSIFKWTKAFFEILSSTNDSGWNRSWNNWCENCMLLEHIKWNWIEEKHLTEKFNLVLPLAAMLFIRRYWTISSDSISHTKKVSSGFISVCEQIKYYFWLNCLLYFVLEKRLS